MFSVIPALAQLEEQQYYTKHFHLESGLSQAVVTDIVQDKTGFIWLSTYDGLNRFDGDEFKVFRYVPNDSTSIPTPKINKLFYDKNKHLWLYSQNGIKVFSIEKGKTLHPKNIYNLKLQSICHDSGTTLWGYAKDKKLYAIHRNKFSIEFESIPNDLISNNEEPLNLICTQQEILLVTTAGNIYTFNKDIKKWSKQYNLISKKDISYATAVFDNQKIVYLGSMQSDLLEYNILTKKFSISQANTSQIKLLGINDLHYNKKKNALLISTYGQGIFYYDRNKKETFQYKQGESQLQLSANYPLSLLVDKNQSIWVGYDGRGLDVLDPNIKKFTPLRHESDIDKFSLQFVRKITEDDQGIVWFGTAGSGLVAYDRIADKFTFYNTGLLEPSAQTFIIGLTKVNNTLWLGLHGGGIAIFDLRIRRITKVLKAGNSPQSLTGNTIWSLLYDKKRNSVWAGTNKKGINRIDIKTFDVKQYYSKNNPQLQNNGIRTIFLSSQDELLAGTTNGLLKLNRRADIFERVYPQMNTELKNLHSIKHIYEDKSRRFWLGTDGAGIAVIDKDYNLLKNFTTINGLSNNVIYGIAEQTPNSLWVSSNNGLSNIIWTEEVFTQKGEIEVYNYNVQSGLQGNEFNTGSVTKLSDGALAFGGLNGANIFHGKDIQTAKTTPTIVITDFSVFNQQINNDLMTPYLNKVNLNYNQNSFSLVYNAVGVTLPEKIKYRYRLVGYDKDWVDHSNRKYVSYTNLNAGKYEFRVMASNYDGYWGDKYTKLEITITKPLYKRWWFLIGLALLISLIIWAILKNRAQQRAEKESMKIQYTKEIAEVEMKALRAQINPHFLFNSLNSINNFILKNDNVNARKYLVKFSQLVRNILNNSTAPYVSLKEELDTISLYIQIESMRFDNQFNYHVEIDKILNAAEVNIPSLLLQPYIENAIWHGLLHKEGRKNIQIRIKRKTEDLISIEIEDNGIGRKAAENLTSKENRRKSYGMQLGENRLKLMNSEHQSRGDVEVIDLFNEDGIARGTLIAITLPIIKRKIKKLIN